MIFVYGSNLAGIHGAGAARIAHKHYGAKWGDGVNPSGNSYPISTKDRKIQTLPLKTIEGFVDIFLLYARNRPTQEFKVTQIGCGLAGYTPAEIAPMFIGGQSNIYYDTAWKDFLKDDSKFWGTHP